MINKNRYKYQTRKRSYKAFMESLPDGYDFEKRDDYGETMLESAICNKNSELVDLLINKYKVDVNYSRKAYEYEIFYPMESAALVADEKSAKLLLACPEFLVARNDDKALHYAAQKAKACGIIRMLIKAGYDVNHFIEGRTALHWAVQEARFDNAILLIENGADISACDETSDDKETPLLCAFSCLEYDDTKKMVELLLNSGANPNSNAVIINAACDDRPDIIKMLLDCGAYINIRDENGLTALHCAVYKGKNKAAEFLIKAGASLNIKDGLGYTAKELMENPKLIKLYLKEYEMEED